MSLRVHRVLSHPNTALKVAEPVPVEQPDNCTHACRVREDADAVVAVEQSPSELGFGLESGAGHPKPGSVVKIEPKRISGSEFTQCHANPPNGKLIPYTN